MQSRLARAGRSLKDSENSCTAPGHLDRFRAQPPQLARDGRQFRMYSEDGWLKIVFQREMVQTGLIQGPGDRLKLSQDKGLSL
jgi:hypothetical protein